MRCVSRIKTNCVRYKKGMGFDFDGNKFRAGVYMLLSLLIFVFMTTGQNTLVTDCTSTGDAAALDKACRSEERRVGKEC